MGAEALSALRQKSDAVARGTAALEAARVPAEVCHAAGLIERAAGPARSGSQLLRMAGVDLARVERLVAGGAEGELRGELGGGAAPLVEPVAREAVEVLVKYQGYIGQQEARVRAARKAAAAGVALPAGLSYRAVPGLSHEEVEKLEAAQPATITAAQAVAGVTPAAIERLLAHLQRARTMRRAVGEEVG